MKIDPLKLIRKYFKCNNQAYHAVLSHGLQVATKALAIASRMNLPVDKEFVKEAAILHDIGVVKVKAPYIGLAKSNIPYICHGIAGREILENEGLPLHALVCERHIGVGFSKDEIIKENLPLPARDMLPETLEEKLVCFADKFFTKGCDKEKTIEYVAYQIKNKGAEKAARFHEMASLFGYSSLFKYCKEKKF